MKVKLLSLLIVVAAFVPSVSFAGWGAIACDVRGSGACGAAAGWANLGIAEAEALAACNRSGYNCYIYQWEHNLCIYGPNGSYACN